MKLNKTSVDKLPASEGKKQIYYFDDELKGFAVRVSGDTKTFVVQSRVNGRKVRVTLGRYGQGMTVEQARKLAKERIGVMASGVDLIAAKNEKRLSEVTLAQTFEQYVEARKADGGLRPKTLDVYRSALRRCFPDWLGEPITDITKDAVIERFRELATRQGRRSNLGGAKAQAAQAMRVLRAVLNFAQIAYEDESGKSLIAANPVERLTKMHRGWSRVAPRTDVIEPEDMQVWYQAVISLPNQLMADYLLICLFMGLRRSAAAKLKWSDINGRARTIMIPAENDKTHRAQRLPVPDIVWAMLERRSKLPRRLGNDYVFPSEDGSGHIQEPKKAIARVVAQSGVKFSMHTLRRTFATTAERMDISYYRLKRLLNHSLSNDVTGQHYVQVDVEQLREPMQKICDYLKEKCGIADGVERNAGSFVFYKQ